MSSSVARSHAGLRSQPPRYGIKLILQGWSAAVKPLIIVVIVMAVFDTVCLWIASRAFRKTLG